MGALQSCQGLQWGFGRASHIYFPYKQKYCSLGTKLGIWINLNIIYAVVQVYRVVFLQK